MREKRNKTRAPADVHDNAALANTYGTTSERRFGPHGARTHAHIAFSSALTLPVSHGVSRYSRGLAGRSTTYPDSVDESLEYVFLVICIDCPFMSTSCLRSTAT